MKRTKSTINRNQLAKSPDAAVLKHMRRLGGNVTKPHFIESFLYFPTEEDAREAEAELAAQGFAVDVNQSAKGAEWLCLATKEMVPEYPDLVALRRSLTALANKFNGIYDGWGTLVE
jgi:hypothetical protein